MKVKVLAYDSVLNCHLCKIVEKTSTEYPSHKTVGDTIYIDLTVLGKFTVIKLNSDLNGKIVTFDELVGYTFIGVNASEVKEDVAQFNKG